MRAILRETFTDADGDIQSGKALTFYEIDGTTPIATTIYASATGSTPATLTTDSNGEVALYSNYPKLVQIAVVGRTTKAISGFMPDLSHDAVRVSDFGATGNGSTDDTLAIQGAIDAVTGSSYGGGTVEFGPGIYSHTGLTITDRVILRGAGAQNSRLFLRAGASATTDGVTVVSASIGGSVPFFGGIYDLTLNHQATGRHALAFNVGGTNGTSALYTVERCYLNGNTAVAAGRAVAVIGADASHTFFLNRFLHCLITGGAQLLSVADSVFFDSCWFTGANVGIQASTVGGAAKWTISRCTFVSTGGGVWMQGMIAPTITDCYFERGAALSGGSGNSALLDLDGVAAADIISPQVTNNQFSVLAGVTGSAIRLKNVTNAWIEGNDFLVTDAGVWGVLVTTGTTGTHFGAGNRLFPGSLGTLVANSLDTAFGEVPVACWYTGGLAVTTGNLALLGIIRPGRYVPAFGAGVVSSASSIALPGGTAGDGGNVFFVSGTTTINTLTPRSNGSLSGNDEVTLIATGAWNLGGAGNIRASVAAMTASRAVQLVYDAGTALWYEIGRGGA